MKKVIFAGGGTGGHFYPIVSIIRELYKKNKSQTEIYFFGPDDYGQDFLKKEKIRFYKVLSGKLRRYFSLKNIISPFLILAGTIQTIYLLNKIKPQLVFLKGGYGSLPVGVAALIYRIPIILHESDTELGLINKLFARWAKLFLLSFPETRKHLLEDVKTELVGNPVRSFEYRGDIEEARKSMEIIDQEKPILLVLGGSQGSIEINELIFNLLENLVKDFFIIHSVGIENFEKFKTDIQTKYGKTIFQNYRYYPFVDENLLAKAYFLADIIIARAGSGIIFEIAQTGKPAVLIPLIGSAADHQRKNAYAYMAKGACLVMEKPNLKKGLFLETLHNLIIDKQKRDAMSTGARSFARSNAAKDIAQIIIRQLNVKR